MQSFEMFRRFLLFLDLIPLSSKHTLFQTPDATNLAKVHIKGQHAGNQNSFHTNTNTQVQKYKYTIIQTQIEIQTHKHRMWLMQKIKVLKTRIFWHKTWNTQRAHATQLVKFLNKGQIGRNLFSLKHTKFHSKDLGTGNYNCVSTKHEQTMHLSGVGGWGVSMP